MPIEKLTEFAKDGQKNTDELNLEVGFVVNRKPARQWFNYLFNMLSLKINELINLDPIARVEIINDLTTNDKKKPLSSAMGKKLQEEKIAISDLVNDFTTGGLDKAPTAESIKSLFSMFANNPRQSGYLKLPNPSNLNANIIVQWGTAIGTTGNLSATYPIAFPTAVLQVFSCLADKSAGELKNISLYQLGSTIDNKSTVTIMPVGSDSLGTTTARFLAIGF